MKIQTLIKVCILSAAVSCGAGTAFADDCQDAHNTIEFNECGARVYAKADDELNQIYKLVLARNADLKSEIRQSQRQWILFRDAECKAASDMWKGGTGMNYAYLSCMAQLTRQRTDYLKATYLIEH